MTTSRTKIADRGVSKPIALRLPKDVRQEAIRLAEQEGVSLNRHATEAYMRGRKNCNAGAKP